MATVTPLLADIDLTSPTSLLLAGVLSVSSGLVILWKVSRTDKDAQLAAKEAALADYRARELKHIDERSQWVEIQLRFAKAQELIATRLDALERRAVKP